VPSSWTDNKKLVSQNRAGSAGWSKCSLAANLPKKGRVLSTNHPCDKLAQRNTTRDQ